MAKVDLDCRAKNCPVPLVEVRKALRKASPGDEIVVVGTHPASRKEIPMAVEATGDEVVEVRETGNEWTIRIRKR